MEEFQSQVAEQEIRAGKGRSKDLFRRDRYGFGQFTLVAEDNSSPVLVGLLIGMQNGELLDGCVLGIEGGIYAAP